jgi:hypothetical protein
MQNHFLSPLNIPRRVAVSITPLVLTLFMPFLVGCPDLNQVQQLAKTADGAKSSITAIAADFKGTCDRQNRYIHIKPDQPPPTKPCISGEDLEMLGKNLIAEQNILLEYMDTLGTLAGTDASGFEKIAPSLNTQFKTAEYTSTQQEMAASAGTLASNITKMATAVYREKKILEILKDADPAVQKLTQGLANQVASDPKSSAQPSILTYLGLLKNEEICLDSYYQNPLLKDDSLTGMLVRVQYRDALAQLKARENAASAYWTLMNSIGQAHAKLLADSQNGGFSKANVQKIAKDLAQPVSDMTSAISTLQTDMR